MEDIQRTPRGRWEKIGFWLLVFPVFPAVILNDIFEALGLPFWGSILIVLALLALTFYLLLRPIRAERSRRLAQDLERGVFDCAIRFPRSTPGSLRDMWEFGAGQIQDTTFRKPRGWMRGWQHVDLRTDGGLIQIAGSEPTCTFIAAALTTSHETNDATKNGEETGQKPSS